MSTRLAFELRRKRAERTLAQVGAEMGLSTSSLHRVERGRSTCDIIVLVRICEWLAMPVGDFVDRAGLVKAPAWRKETAIRRRDRRKRA